MRKSRVSGFFILSAILFGFSCTGPESEQAVLSAEFPLHLEEHLEAARIEGSEVPEDVPASVEWRFDEPQPDWKPVVPPLAFIKPVQITHTDDALRLTMTEANRGRGTPRRVIGAIYIDLPDWNIDDWGYILVTARATENVRDMSLCFNLFGRAGPDGRMRWYMAGSTIVPIINDGAVHSYLLRVRADWSHRELEGKWKQLIIHTVAKEPTKFDILSVSVIPKAAMYASTPTGVSTEVCSNAYRRTLYTHAPGRIEYRVRVPQAGRLDVGLGALREDVPVTFKILASQTDEEEVVLFEETYANQEEWGQRSVDLSGMAGKTVKIALEVDAERVGTVALWAAPTLTGTRSTKKPNIIFYIIDGAGADHMSVYGYNRRTTPNLERLAAEGAIFEHAFSNSTWTKVSNPSFMTSLHNSVLGGYKSDSDPLPDQAVTMAQNLHRAGYQTAVFTSNAYCGTLSSFDRGVDVLREEDIYEQYSVSSKKLQEQFWRWREAYPSEPYWVHFQTTDVHGPSWKAVAPFAGLFISPEQRQSFYEWQRQMSEAGGGVFGDPYSDVWEKTGISRLAFSHARGGLYDEAMAHNDYQIGQLVKRLKAAGEWHHTLLIIAADHAHKEAGLLQLDPLPPKWGAPLFTSFCTRIPMIFIWPGKIAAGQRFSQPVSMIDMLPTILDLADLPMPEVMQGQSLAPLLLGEEGWEQRPVILDEFYVDLETGRLGGLIEVVDGRWGASLEINPDPENPPEEKRPVPLLLFDLWNDPYCLHSLHEERTDLVEKYTKFLETQWKAHQALAQHFTRSKDSPLTPEQLRILRSLGYIK
jgi:arylsulfatase A-like enzyme